MAHPFINEKEEFGDSYFIDFEIYDYVYKFSRYAEEYSVKPMYIPSKKLIFTMMRACINVTKTSHLWFNI